MRELAIVACLAVAGTASAEDAVIRNPPWRYEPGEAAQLAFYPDKATARDVRGYVVLRCRGGAGGRLEACVALDETPVDFGFGDAAVAFAGKFVLQPTTKDGRSTVGATIEFPIYFTIRRFNMAKRSLLFYPHWDMTPSHQDMAGAWSRLPAGSPPGRVIFNCNITRDGRLDDCKVINSEPADSRYEQAARPLLSIFHVTLKPEEMIHGGVSAQVPINLRHPALPPSDPNQVRIVTNPRWIQGPTPKQMAEAFPSKAATAGISEGKAALECMVDRGGLMSACEAVSDVPQGMGFAEAALKVAPAMGVLVWTTDGEPVEGAYVDFAVTLKRTSPSPAPASPDTSRRDKPDAATPSVH